MYKHIRVIYRNSWKGIMHIKELCKHENLYKLKGVATSRPFGALILINFSGYLNLQ